MKAKSPISVRRASELAFSEMPDTFSANTFCTRVRIKTMRPMLMDSSILRRLREARADNLDYYYECIDNEKALYRKGKIMQQ